MGAVWEEDPCALKTSASQVAFGLRVGAIFIVMFVSGLGAFLPLLARHGCALPPLVLKLGRAFGTGVILATAFIHMLPPALAALTNPCLPKFFTDTYASFGGLLALLAVLLVQGIEYFCTVTAENRFKKSQVTTGTTVKTYGTTQVPHDDHDKQNGDDSPKTNSNNNNNNTNNNNHGNNAAAAANTEENGNDKEPLAAADRKQASKSDIVVHVHDSHHDHEHEHEDHGHSHSLGLTEMPGTLSAQVMVVVLEIGISFHSVIIGIALGVLEDSEFTTLLIAISFHQFFEGFALGATVLDAAFHRSCLSYLSVFVYGLTTPLGVMIGILISNTYNPNSQRGLLIQGCFDAISGGILIYAALVNLLSQQYTQNTSFRKEPPGIQISCFLAIYLGAGAMAMIGAYA